MFGIDPVANRNNRRADAALERQIAAEIKKQELANQGAKDVTTLQGANEAANIGKRGAEDRLTNAERAKFDQILQTMVNQGNMSVEQARGLNNILNTQTQGTESRKNITRSGQENRRTQAESAGQAKDLENTRSSNTISERTRDQQLGILSKDGVVYSPENLSTYDKALSDPRMRGALQQVQQVTEARNSPGFVESLAQGLQAQNLAPAFGNIKSSALSAAPGELLVAPPSGTSLPPADLNQWNQMQGALQSETITPAPMYKGVPMGDPTTTRTTMPGRIKINPSIIQKAAQTPGATNRGIPPVGQPQYSVEQLLQGAGVVPFPGMSY
jgi:polyhydroxyalkanoate synthesis regulator phasin